MQPSDHRANIDEVLRRLVDTAVERQVLTVLAPVRDKLLLLDGYYRELNTRTIKGDQRIEDLEAIVRGSTELGLSGLVTKVDATVAMQQLLLKRLDEADQAAKAREQKQHNYFVAGRWVATVLIGLGLLDNERLGALLMQLLAALKGAL